MAAQLSGMRSLVLGAETAAGRAMAIALAAARARNSLNMPAASLYATPAAGPPEHGAAAAGGRHRA